MKRLCASALLIASAAFVESAYAFIDPPYLTPVSPTEGQDVSVNTRLGICDAIISQEGFPRISQVGTTVTITYYGQHWDGGKECIFGIGTATDSLGSFAVGAHSVIVLMDYYDFFGQPNTLTIGTIDFTVTAAAPSAPPVSLPTSTAASLILLAMALVALAITRISTSRSTPAHDLLTRG